MTNEPDFISCISVGASLHGCDHDAVYFTLYNTYPSLVPRSRVLLKYKDVDPEYLNEVFSHVPWDDIDLIWCHAHFNELCLYLALEVSYLCLSKTSRVVIDAVASRYTV